MSEPYPEAPLNGAAALEIDGEQPGENADADAYLIELEEYVGERAW